MPRKRKRSREKARITFDGACASLEAILKGPVRHEILAEISKARSRDEALEWLGECMRSHLFPTGGNQISLSRLVRQFDGRTCEDGFHALHDWDGKADEIKEDMIAVDVLNFMIGRSTTEGTDEKVLAILLDYYFFYVLALLSLRVWDEGRTEEHLDRVSGLLRHLQGPYGSGQQFAANAETLILIATSHFEPDEHAYERLLGRARTLDPPHRTTMALAHAPILASHLRFGFEATYGRDIVSMRNDNTPDYPWLCFALASLMQAYARLDDDAAQGGERERIVEGIVNGLSPDPRAFVGKPPDSLSDYQDLRSEFLELFERYRGRLLEEFEHHRPSEPGYSPIAFYFNFSHNVLKGIVVDALFRGEAWNLTLNDLLTGIPRDETVGKAKRALVKTLMDYARSSPDTIRGRPVPAIVYDPRKGRRAFTTTIRKIVE